MRKTTLKKLASMLIAIVVGIVLISNSYYSYVSANSANTIVESIETKMASSRSVSTSTEGALVATISSSPAAVTVESGGIENAVSKTMVKLGSELAQELETAKKKELAQKQNSKKNLSLNEVRKKLNKEMDLSKPSGLSKKKFVKLIHDMDYDYTGFFKRNAEYVWNLAHKYGFNEVFFMAIAANESWWGSSEQALATNNYTSQMKSVRQKKKVGKKTKTIYVQKLKPYETEKQCLKETARNLGKNYLRKNGKYFAGVTLRDVNKHYCVPGVHKDGTPYKYKWADDVYGCMKMILRK